IQMEDKQRFIINGGVRVTELEPKLNFPFPTGDYVTLGGLINHHLGRIAEVGDLVQLEGANLKVLEKDNHRVTKALFEYQEPEEPEETEPQVEEKKAKRSFMRRSSEKDSKGEKDQPEAQVAKAAEGPGKLEKEADS
ncbi:MAG: hypothetical protein GY721_07295, partial [Deltaproteobacteria bacterium]|nr:hypothetical protein [Deltaproteobacteria bacterium]